jgi:hypothetical protein
MTPPLKPIDFFKRKNIQALALSPQPDGVGRKKTLLFSIHIDPMALQKRPRAPGEFHDIVASCEFR